MQSFAERIEAGMQEGAEETEIGESRVSCDRCKGNDVRYRETRKKKDGVSVMYQCLDDKCGKKFVHAPGFRGRHYSLETITDALFQAASGMFPAAVSQGLAKRGKSVSPGTIYRWIGHYGALLKRLTDALLAPRTGREWSTDELHLLPVGGPAWMFGVMDTESRAIIHYEPSRTKMGFNGTGLFEKAVELAGRCPDILVTDKLHGFASGFKRAVSKKAGRRRRPYTGRTRASQRCTSTTTSTRGSTARSGRGSGAGADSGRRFKTEIQDGEAGACRPVHGTLQPVQAARRPRWQDAGRGARSINKRARQVEGGNTVRRPAPVSISPLISAASAYLIDHVRRRRGMVSISPLISAASAARHAPPCGAASHCADPPRRHMRDAAQFGGL